MIKELEKFKEMWKDLKKIVSDMKEEVLESLLDMDGSRYTFWSGNENPYNHILYQMDGMEESDLYG